MPRLVITRLSGQSVWIGDNALLTVYRSSPAKYRATIEAPRSLSVRRGEIELQPPAAVGPEITRLTLHRRNGQSLWIGRACITFWPKGPTRIRLTIEAPEHLPLLRGELWGMLQDSLPPVAEAACAPPRS